MLRSTKQQVHVHTADQTPSGPNIVYRGPKIGQPIHHEQHHSNRGQRPNYPQGTIDPISDLSTLAVARNVGLHVDCCLGGFVLPFGKKHKSLIFLTSTLV